MAVYYNGFLIMCILIGAYIGFLIFQWHELRPAVSRRPSAGSLEGKACGCPDNESPV